MRVEPRKVYYRVQFHLVLFLCVRGTRFRGTQLTKIPHPDTAAAGAPHVGKPRGPTLQQTVGAPGRRSNQTQMLTVNPIILSHERAPNISGEQGASAAKTSAQEEHRPNIRHARAYGSRAKSLT